MKQTLAIIMLTPAVAWAQLGSLGLPAAPSWSNGTDKVQSSDGVRCESSAVPRQWYMDVGVVAGRGNGLGAQNGTVIDINSQYIANNFERNTFAVYARVVINLENAPKPIDCNALYALEIERLQAEIEYLKFGEGVVGAVVK